MPADWRSRRVWRLRELAIRREVRQMRIAIINTLASGSGHILRMLPIVVAQALQPDKYAVLTFRVLHTVLSFAVPSSSVHV